MARLVEIFLDIETDAAPWHSPKPIVVGFYSASCGLNQLVGTEITRRRLTTLLPRAGCLYTFNGRAFDVRVIRNFLGIDLADRFESRDLMWICRRNGIFGGQKVIEKKIGFRRRAAGMNGSQVPDLWRRYSNGDGNALSTILGYNAEDVEGLRYIRRYIVGLN